MNTILLQKILDILTEGLTHVGDFFKDLFITDPQDGQVIGYDAEEGKWKNIDIAELSFDITNTAGPAASISISNAAADMPVKSLSVNIEPHQASGTPSPANPLPISGTDSVVITHTYGDNVTETKTVSLPSTVYGGAVDLVSGSGSSTYIIVDLGDLTYTENATYPNVFNASIATALSKNTTNAICSCYERFTSATVAAQDYGFALAQSRNIIYFKNKDISTKEAFKEAMTGQKICYELATPTSISTTPAQINTQGGSETFAVDANEMEMEYYTSTAGTIKDLVSITEDITSEITKNTTDFSDILLKVSQNNKVVSVEIYSATTAAAVNDTFLSNLPKPAMNSKVLLANTTLGEDGTILGTLKTTGELEITTPGAKSFSGLITYVAK